MHQATKKIHKILDKLDSAEARAVIDEIVGIFNKDGCVSTQVIMANCHKSPEEVCKILESKCREDGFGSCSGVDKISEGLSAVEFDFENSDYVADSGYKPFGNLMGQRYFGNVPGVGCYAGGDWEYPVFFIVYLDVDGKTLRSYVPKEGNVWNYDTRSAFGNNEDLDYEFLVRWIKENHEELIAQGFEIVIDNVVEDARIMFNESRILKDIQDNLKIA